MKKNKTYMITVGILILFCVGVLSYTLYGVWQKQQAQEVQEEEPAAPEAVGKDTAVVLYIDDGEQEIRFYSIKQKKTYTLFYTGTTYINDKYGEAMSIAQLMPGEVVDVVFKPSSKTASELNVSEAVKTYKDIRRFYIDEEAGSLSIGTESFTFDESLVVASGTKLVELMDIDEQDVLTLKGNGKQIYSIMVDKGHGYIRIINDTYFVGGWIEVGQSMIRPVTEDMLMVVPEGTYDINITNGGNKGKATLTVKRDEETVFDISEIEIEEVERGRIAFHIVPSYAILSIDGQITPYEELVELEYGVHKLVLKADGYRTISSMIKVGQPLADIEIEMDLEEEQESSSASSSSRSSSSSSSSSSSGSSSSSSSTSESYSGLPYSFSSSAPASQSSSESAGTESSVSASGNRIYIDGPEGVEVYLDGTYMGVAPVNFKKVPGNHVITLRKDGFITKSYTIQVESDEENMSWSFSDLVAE